MWQGPLSLYEVKGTRSTRGPLCWEGEEAEGGKSTWAIVVAVTEWTNSLKVPGLWHWSSCCPRVNRQLYSSGFTLPWSEKYSDWRHFNVSLYSWCNWSLFLSRSYFHSHLSQHKSGVNLGKVTWLYWSLWKCTCRRSQSGLVLTENTYCPGRAKLRYKFHDPAFDMGLSFGSPIL